jgi:hypothetical protein
LIKSITHGLSEAGRRPHLYIIREHEREEDQMAGSTGSGEETPKGGATASMNAGSAVAEGLQDIARAWAEYAQQIMQRTTDATQALVRCQNFNDVLGVQAELMRGHLQAFLDQSTKLAEITNRMAVRSMDAIRGSGKQAENQQR